MTAQEILAAYPDCRVAVAWCEFFLTPSRNDPRDLFEAFRAVGLSPARVRGEILEMMTSAADENGPGRHAEALKQTKHPSFLTYLAGKLGAT